MNIEWPLELLQVLIAMGGEGVQEARLIDALRPDSEGDLAMQSLRTTISRLRRLLGRESALVTGGRPAQAGSTLCLDRPLGS